VAHLRLGELLVQAGALTQEKLEYALKEQARSKLRLGQILVDHHLISEAAMVDALARTTGLPRLDIATIHAEPIRMRSLMDPWTAEREAVVPLHADDAKRTLVIAVADPTHVVPLDDLAFRSGLRVQCILGTAAEIGHLINHVFHGTALDRGFSERVRQPGGHLQPGEIIHSIAVEPGTPAYAGPQAAAPVQAPMEPEPSLSDLFGPILMVQERLALELQVAFELLVEKGWLSQEAYMARLARPSDPDR
jgi:type IV pilus assembly protein PilB